MKIFKCIGGCILIDFKTQLFKTMGHPTRLRILELLRTGEKTVGELQQALDIDPSSVSQQLSVMRTRQLVDARKQGTSVYYTVRDELVFDIMDIARQIFQNQISTMQSMLTEPDELL
ncbi:winged helix-turn-helix transcriptional regulator [Alicyclobacillus mengziensis]|uniref:Winged helix-turn-helix transcriptional regulator n=1 Tax=Alicyclobacillus mengziensis TaxID=2931921 RepID=A0A9X7VZM7_9BACL|nr:winged helix-turn-helix transcriptional regulator [Alicyclobacillus mengziensis]